MSKSIPARAPLRRRILPGILRRLKPIGIQIDPFLVVREGEKPLDLDTSASAFQFGFLSEAEIDELIHLQPGAVRSELLDWFGEGKLCFGVKHNKRLVAKMWCDLDAFNYPPNYRRLLSNEAYLFAAYADPDYRGQNIAPQMRAACYSALRSMGRTVFFSYTEYFNESARRFKVKLGARDEELRLHIGVFQIWSKSFRIKRFR